MTTLDRGLSITWYDLPAEGRDEYFSWLHDVYMPEILRRPGSAWSAKMVPKLIHAPGSSNVAVRIWPGPQQAA